MTRKKHVKVSDAKKAKLIADQAMAMLHVVSLAKYAAVYTRS